MKRKIVRLSLFVLCIAAVAGCFKIFVFSSEPDENNDDHHHREFVRKNYRIFSIAIPDTLSFAGEKVPIGDIEIRERMDHELVINTYWHSQSLFFIKRANRWFPVIEPILKQEGIPDDFKYLALIESGFENVVSPAGASGYWQFLKSTGINYGLEINSFVDERYNVELSTKAACKYFKEAYAIFKNWTLVAASYNMGIGGVQEKLKEQNVKSYYDLLLIAETSRYVFRILSAKEICEHPLYYGFNVRKKDLYPPLETFTLQIDSTINNLVTFSEKNNINYKVLKYFNPWLRDKSLPNKAKKTYKILLPSSSFNLKANLNEQR